MGRNEGPQRQSPELRALWHAFGGKRDIVDMVSHAPCTARRTAAAKLSCLLYEGIWWGNGRVMGIHEGLWVSRSLGDGARATVCYGL